MTSFDDRRRAEEAKFTHDAEMAFRIQARRNRLLGEWAARNEDVIRRLLGDITSANVEISEAEVRAALDDKEIEARRALMGAG